MTVRIVVAQRGWVFVGEWNTHGDEVILQRAKSIRRWGTSQGLGQLINGPTDSTVLDPAGTVRLHRLGIVATYDCNPEKWAAVLARD